MSLPPVDCLYVTTDCIREWKEGNTDFKLPNPVPVSRFLYELCWRVVRGELPFQKCKAALDSVEFLDESQDALISSHLADIVAQMGQDITMPADYRSRLIGLTKWLVESALVPVRLLQERCEEEFLWESKMIKIKAADLKSKEVRVNTCLLYQRTIFNLLCEESVGYAKLVILLSQVSDASGDDTPKAIVGTIKSLIGHFDLDPNRVFDIVLEFLELQPHNSIFLDLIPIFPKSHASQILGFKFQYYQRMEVNQIVPFSLYQLTALLVKGDFIDLDSIYAYLLPKDEEAFRHYNAFSSKRLEEANKFGKINLVATGKDLMEEEKQGDVTIDLYAALDIESEAVSSRSSELANNQALGLLTGLLSVDDWYHAHILLDRLSFLNPAEHSQICNEMFRLIEKSLSPTYEHVRKTSVSNRELPIGNDCDSMGMKSSIHNPFVDVPKELFEMLASVGPYLYCNSLLLQKVCRVLKGYYLSAVEFACAGDEASTSGPGIARNSNPRIHLKEVRLRIEEAMGSCLLPSLQLIPANPAVGQEIWDVMNLLPYEVRYRLYGEWEKDDERTPMILTARQIAKLDTGRILKRLAKENLKQLGRMVAKLAHASPLTVLRTIVNQIEAYRDMITHVVYAFKYLTQLEYEILEYVVIERLAQSGWAKLKDDGVSCSNLSDSLQSLASFWGLLCKEYPSMELRGLFQYLVNQLKRGIGIELVVVQELIQHMANVQYIENMTEEQLDSMSGSDSLRCQATAFGITPNKALIKSTNRLRDSLLPKDEPKLAIPLLLLIAQHRSVVVTNADMPYIKMVSDLFDRCHGTLLLYVEFLCSAVTPTTAYAQLIPSLNDLIHLYHLDSEVAFLIYRPVMRLFKCPNANVSWPLDDNEFTMALAAKESEPIQSSDKLGHPQKPTLWSDFLGTVKTMLPAKAWNSLSTDLYATFWGLTLYDLYVPRSRYESEIAKRLSALKALEECNDSSSSAITKRKKDMEKIQESLDRLTNELQKHEEIVSSVHRRLTREKDKWLSSCPDKLKINMEFLQRCIFPRCTFSMPDAVYCAKFVHTLHSLGTPFFNTVNHIDVLICKTLHPMICCCTEYEVGRLGRFLYETLKIANYWKSDETIYERECRSMPGFSLYFSYPNRERVTYGQFIKVHRKWILRITRLLIHCLESTEYMEIRNSLIMLTKISSVFPVTQNSGINILQRVAKLKNDEREDLKVLAIGVSAALAARKPSWLTEEEFRMGYLELKPTAPLAPKPLFDGELERTESALVKSDTGHRKVKAGSLPKGPRKGISTADSQASMQLATTQGGASKVLESQKQPDELAYRSLEDNSTKPGLTLSTDKGRASAKRALPSGSLSNQPRQDLRKADSKSGKAVGRPSDRDVSHPFEGKQGGERHDRDHRDYRLERQDKLHWDDIPTEWVRERSMKRQRREHSLDKGGFETGREERSRNDRGKLHHSESLGEESHVHGEYMQPPKPFLPRLVTQSDSPSNRREEDAHRRFGTARHLERFSSEHDERERRRSEENAVRCKRKEDFCYRKRDEREPVSVKEDDREKQQEREREKVSLLKEDMGAASERRKLKIEHMPEPGEYSPVAPHPPLAMGASQFYDGWDRGDRRPVSVPRDVHLEEPSSRIQKEATSKVTRQQGEQAYERELDDEKQNVEQKRRRLR